MMRQDKFTEQAQEVLAASQELQYYRDRILQAVQVGDRVPRLGRRNVIQKGARYVAI